MSIDDSGKTRYHQEFRSNMGTSRRITESQLERAKAELAVRVKALTDGGVDAKKFKSDPVWRKLDARVRQISMRLRKVAEIESNNAEVARLKEERLARIVAEKAERKAAGGKKAKPEKEKEKEKAKGEAKAAKKEKPPKEKAPKEKKEKSKE